MLAVLPTGGGKSIIVSDLVRQKDATGWSTVVIAHRKELVGQMSLHMARQGVYHRIIGSRSTISDIVADHRYEYGGRSFINPGARCTVASVDTIISRKEELSAWAAQVGLWVIDEGHHVLRENKWGVAVSMFKNGLGLGVTASPLRADGNGLGGYNDGVFSKMVVGPSMRDLITAGHLCDYEIAVPDSDFNVDELTITAGGDYSQKSMKAASEKSHIVGDIVEQYIKLANGKKGITFATDVETAHRIADQFNANGIAAAAVSGETPAAVRGDFIRRFRAGALLQLVNVDLFGEGFDLPAIEVVSMARPTHSLTVFLQQFGRALRTMPGKKSGLIIDHVSNIKRHGFPDKPRRWSLDRREKGKKRVADPDEIPITVCKKCLKPFERLFRACPHCGAAISIETRGSIAAIDGDLTLLDRETLEKMRVATELESPAALGDRVNAVAGPIAARGRINSQIEKIQAQEELKENIAIWAGIERDKGRDDAQSYRRFYHAAGIDVFSSLALDRVGMVKLNEEVKRWIAN